MSTHSLRDLRGSLAAVMRALASTGQEAMITDSGSEVAVIISLADYERLHEHPDAVDALRLRELRANAIRTAPLAELLDELGADAEVFATGWDLFAPEGTQMLRGPARAELEAALQVVIGLSHAPQPVNAKKLVGSQRDRRVDLGKMPGGVPPRRCRRRSHGAHRGHAQRRLSM